MPIQCSERSETDMNNTIFIIPFCLGNLLSLYYNDIGLVRCRCIFPYYLLSSIDNNSYLHCTHTHTQILQWTYALFACTHTPICIESISLSFLSVYAFLFHRFLLCFRLFPIMSTHNMMKSIVYVFCFVFFQENILLFGPCYQWVQLLAKALRKSFLNTQTTKQANIPPKTEATQQSHSFSDDVCVVFVGVVLFLQFHCLHRLSLSTI